MSRFFAWKFGRWKCYTSFEICSRQWSKIYQGNSENYFEILNPTQEICFYYIIPDHWTPFITNKEGVKILGMNLFQEVIDFHQKHMDGKLKPLVIPPKPINTILQDFKKIYEDMENADLTVRVGDQFIECHKAVLAARSGALAELVKFPTVGKLLHIDE
jgi:hypothetical protein